MSWTDERIATLKTMWEAGQTASQIAEALGGVSRNAVIGKAHRLELQARPSPVKPNDPEAKAAAAAKAGSERTQASIDKLAADVSKNSNERRAANDARWATLMEKTDIKLELEKSKVAVKKRR